MTNWRPAKALAQLLAQVNTAHPGRSKASDGVIGDSAHAASASDHNPDAGGVVHALDITHDPAKGCDAVALANALVASQDARIAYVISAGRIASSVQSPWSWRRYNGTDPHTSHVHVSLVSGARADDPKPWTLGATTRPPAEPSTTPFKETIMQLIKGPKTPEVYVTDGITKRWITKGELKDLLALCGQKSPRVIGQFVVDRMPVVKSLP